MRYLITSVLCVILLAACKLGPTTPTTTNEPDYFPLRVGNWWEYAVDTIDSEGKGNYSYAYNYRYEIIGDSLVLGKKYYIMSRKILGKPERDYVYHIYKDPMGNLQYSGNNIIPTNDADSSVEVLDYFNKPIGEEWHPYRYYQDMIMARSKITSKNDTTIVPAGVFFPNCVIARTSDRECWYNGVYAQNIGLVKTFAAGFMCGQHAYKSSLTRAFINGKSFP